MSRIGNELANIAKELGSEVTFSDGDALIAVKEIRKCLDTEGTYTEANKGANIMEEVIAIRELVQNGAGGGGGDMRVFQLVYLEGTGVFEVDAPAEDVNSVLMAGVPVVFYYVDQGDGYAQANYYYVTQYTFDDLGGHVIYTIFGNGDAVSDKWTVVDGKYRQGGGE